MAMAVPSLVQAGALPNSQSPAPASLPLPVIGGTCANSRRRSVSNCSHGAARAGAHDGGVRPRAWRAIANAMVCLVIDALPWLRWWQVGVTSVRSRRIRLLWTKATAPRQLVGHRTDRAVLGNVFCAGRLALAGSPALDMHPGEPPSAQLGERCLEGSGPRPFSAGTISLVT